MKNCSPCTKCEKRHVGCHSDCPDFIEWEKKRSKLKELNDAARKREHMLNDYFLSAKDNMQKKRPTRRKDK